MVTKKIREGKHCQHKEEWAQNYTSGKKYGVSKNMPWLDKALFAEGDPKR